MDYRSLSVPVEGLARLLKSLERRSGQAVEATPAGLVLRRRFDPWPLIAALVFASIAAVVALVLITVPGTWSLIGRVALWAFCGLSLLAGALSVRRTSLTIDVPGRRLHGQDEDHGPIDAPWSDVRSVELVRRPGDQSRGAATMTWVVGDVSHRVLELEGASAPDLTRAKGLALGLAALFGASFVERSTADARARLSASDRGAGLGAADAGDPSPIEEIREMGAAVGTHVVSALDAGVTFLKVLESL